MNHTKGNRVVVSVIGQDQKGIIAKVTAILAKNDVNILDISQTIMQDFFTMVMVVDIKDFQGDTEALSAQFKPLEDEMGLKIRLQHEDIFNFMHRI
ncbi:hypothetical protein BHU72_10340 [Desulfuribacillus stibiiarsenatis]|uniref:UPF0237 protein BHU72_10340 n=1 Tax=Desulfuribacillus stibiiarsenatis TaxID=1390249 RepID=A0A1E5L912_9FIRM|nr:ACT domain-containing protein [Desulfuribacillus stibiiarsenatis]OEH86642.1 hypothetical protein BHU72_10340 [Desulfuribacillus stibiiarsenatis]